MFLSLTVVLAGIDKAQARQPQGARHRDIDCKPVAILPVWNSDVTWPAAGARAKNALFLKLWLQKAI